MEGATIPKITLLGREHAVTLPQDFATRDELLAAWIPAAQKQRNSIHRLNAALVGVCTRFGRHAARQGVKTYEDCGCEPMVYGGLMYTWLTAQGVDLVALNAAAIEIIKLLSASRAPTEKEVTDKADFTDPPEA